MIVAIPTRNRPAMLRRALQSHLPHGYQVRVYDGTTDPSLANENRNIIRQVEHEFRVKIRYASARDIVRYRKLLAQQGISEEVSACLVGDLGAVRNWILLDTVGAKVVMVDDDVLAASSAVEESSFYVAGAGSADPSKYRAYATLEAALLDQRVSDKRSFVSALAEVLGKKVSDLRPDASMVGEYKTGVVRASQIGFVGELPGTDWEGAPLLQAASPLAAYTGEGYAKRVPQLVVKPSSYISTFALGLDNRYGLPPFYPGESRVSGPFGESGYGGVLARASGAWTAFMPVVAAHFPATARAKKQAACLSAASILARAAGAPSYADAARAAREELLRDVSARASSLVESLPAHARDAARARVGALTVEEAATTAQDEENFKSYRDILVAWPDVVEKAKLLLARKQGITVTL